MSKIVPLFKQAVQNPALQESPFRQKAKSQFSMDIEARINKFSTAFDYFEQEILGGLPITKASESLADILFVFLEEKRADKNKGQAPNETMLQELFEAMTERNLILNPSLGATYGSGELKKTTKLVMATVLDKVLSGNAYRPLRNDAVTKGIATYIVGEGRNFVRVSMGVCESNPLYRAEILSYCRQLMGVSYMTSPNQDNLVFDQIKTLLYGERAQNIVKLDKVLSAAPH